VFYTYLWLREKDGTFHAGVPYYAGFGSRSKRAYEDHRRIHPPEDHANILIQHWPSKDTAFAYERYLIWFYGRIDQGTGCLRNLTDGGEGIVGLLRTEEHNRKIGKSQRGKKLSKEHCQKLSKAYCKAKHALRCFSIEARAKISDSNQCRIVLPKTRSKMRNSHIGKRLTPEHCKAIGDSTRGTVIAHERAIIAAAARWSHSC